MKKLFLVLSVSIIVLSLAAFASAQQRGYQGGQSSQYGTQDQQQSRYGTQDQPQQGQYGRQDRSQWQYGRQDQRDQQGRSAFGRSARQQTTTNISRASDLMDKKVQSQQGEELGKVDDLIITRNGRVAFLIVARGGVLGVGDNYIPVPFRSAQLNMQHDAIILPNVNKQALENAPTISKDDWQRLEDPGFERQVFTYYGQQGQQQQQYDTGRYQQQQQQRPMQQQRDSQQQYNSGKYQQEQQRPMQQQRSGQTGR